MEPKRARIIVCGRVQGVCFRDCTRIEAEKLGLTGWVRNRRDGKVEVLAEGENAQLEQLIDYLYDGPPQALVTDVQVRHEAYQGEYQEFCIAPTV
ncbi:MAG TPA: acylphosphatase [Oligoflexia bacterium]|nr:acylphosphatase [Oligoflexia bacterium]